jgi:hypothetical protein
MWIESSLNNLYQSSVRAFPNTKARQYATNTIKITRLEWVPFLGMKTLFVKGLAQNEGKEYRPIILFKKVIYHENEGPHIATLRANDGYTYFLERLSLDNTDVLVKCSCGDFKWRGIHFNKLDGSLYGRDRKKYEALYNPGSANPQEMPILCKHLMKMMKALAESNVVV